MPRARPGNGESGTVIVALAMFLLLLLGFVALATDVGRWYIVRAELSKSVDAGALAAAKNISNPYVDKLALAEEFAYANFPSGYLGTVGSGSGIVSFNARAIGNTRVQVEGHVSATPILSRLYGVTSVPVASAGVAQKSAVEMLMVLDRSGSMAGRPMTDLKRAARSFLDFFAETQAEDRMGLVSFATSVRTDRFVGTNFVLPMQAAIETMSADGGTNMEDALDQADGLGGFTNQNGVPADSRVQQFAILFTDGNPTGFRGTFKQRGRVYDAVACVTGSGGVDDIVYTRLGYPDREDWVTRNGGYVDPTQPGNGNSDHNQKPTTKWYVFETRPVPGHGAEDVGIRNDPGGVFMRHVKGVSRDMALEHAQVLKQNHITIYVIGLGAVDRAYLNQLASSPDLVYYAPTSDQLQGIFQKVAQEIKLRLVQ